MSPSSSLTRKNQQAPNPVPVEALGQFMKIFARHCTSSDDESKAQNLTANFKPGAATEMTNNSMMIESNIRMTPDKDQVTRMSMGSAAAGKDSKA